MDTPGTLWPWHPGLYKHVDGAAGFSARSHVGGGAARTCIISNAHWPGDHVLGPRAPNAKGNAGGRLTYLLPGAQTLQEDDQDLLALAAPLLAILAPQLPLGRQHPLSLLPRAKPLRQQQPAVVLRGRAFARFRGGRPRTACLTAEQSAMFPCFLPPVPPAHPPTKQHTLTRIYFVVFSTVSPGKSMAKHS